MILRLKIILKNMKNDSPLFSCMFNVIDRFYRVVQMICGFINWFLLKPIQEFTPISNTNKRILIIYDLSSQPFAIGDILAFQEASLILREENCCADVDFAFVYDPAHPTVPDPALSSITADNCLFYPPGGAG
jgi:hypothetical protein